MAKRGRPSLGPSKLGSPVHTKLTAEENDQFVAEARAQGLSPSEALRKLARGFLNGSFRLQLLLF